MCLSSCTLLNELGLITSFIGIVGILLVLYYYKTAGKKVAKQKNTLMVLAAISLVLVIAGAIWSVPPNGCDIYKDVVLCKYLRIVCTRC